MRKTISLIAFLCMVVSASSPVYVYTKTPLGYFANLNAFVASRGTTPTSFNMGENWVLTGPLTIPATFVFQSVINGAKIYGSTGSAVDIITINSVFDIPPIQCFDTSVKVVFGRGTADVYYPEWTGGFSSTETAPKDVSVNIQRAVDMVPEGGTLKFSGTNRSDGRYCFQGIVISKPISIVGDNWTSTALKAYDTTANMFTIHNSTAITGYTFQDVQIAGSPAKLSLPPGTRNHHVGVSMSNVVLSSFFRTYTASWDTGILVRQNGTASAPIINFTDCTFGSANQVGLALMLQTNVYCRIIGCWFDENYDKGLYLAGGSCTVIGNHFIDNGLIHLYMDAAANKCTVVGNIFEGGGAPYGTDIAIRCNTDNNVFIGNSIDTSHVSATPFVISAGATDNIISGNYIEKDGISDAGTRTSIMVHAYGTTSYGAGAALDTNYKLLVEGRLGIISNKDATTLDSGAIVAKLGGISAHLSLNVGDTGFFGKAIRSPKVLSDTIKPNTGSILSLKATTTDIVGGMRMKYAAPGTTTSLDLDSLCEGIVFNYKSGTSYLAWRDGLSKDMWQMNRNTDGSLRLQANNRTGDSANFKILPNYTNYDDSVIINAETGNIKTSGGVTCTDSTQTIIMTAQNGKRWRLKLGNDGALSTDSTGQN